jgi:hypothetical protein
MTRRLLSVLLAIAGIAVLVVALSGRLWAWTGGHLPSGSFAAMALPLAAYPFGAWLVWFAWDLGEGRSFLRRAFLTYGPGGTTADPRPPSRTYAPGDIDTIPASSVPERWPRRRDDA